MDQEANRIILGWTIGNTVTSWFLLGIGVVGITQFALPYGEMGKCLAKVYGVTVEDKYIEELSKTMIGGIIDGIRGFRGDWFLPELKANISFMDPRKTHFINLALGEGYKFYFRDIRNNKAQSSKDKDIALVAIKNFQGWHLS